ncbi:fimbria/pilus chaperone family protein [Pseudomonas eucalypticola]|uniref:Fimbria/pilus periplasmic chaperone n=1 Tax=Pseudomonas eucalypticola TaxID=2599595 RepID=A0A7D5H7V1_9PSED|nr:fimbria/pilus chaperone family protein [Pseudomonas eucalypticola]QKZ06343.1 fimbria/pilus periplasmic chaperone [Pseudomonas eucalypticola]
MNLPKPFLRLVVPVLALGLAAQAMAAGMVPDTTVLRVNAADGEASLNVTNTDQAAALLYTSLTDLEQQPQAYLLASPPVTRVEAGEKQLVRFMLKPGQTITEQHMLRVIFEGIPERRLGNPSDLNVTVRQNLPVILHPKGLAEDPQPWKRLAWRQDASTITLSNDSPYVVRLSQHVTLLPDKINLALPHTYVLPRSHLVIDLPAPLKPGQPRSVRLHPASPYGFQGKPYEAPLTCAPDAQGCLQ